MPIIMDGTNKYLLNWVTSYLVGSKRHLTGDRAVLGVSQRQLSIHSTRLQGELKCRAPQGAEDPERSGARRSPGGAQGFRRRPQLSSRSRPDQVQPRAAGASEPVDRLGRSRLDKPPDTPSSSPSPAYVPERATQVAGPRFRPLVSGAGESPQRTAPAGHVARHRAPVTRSQAGDSLPTVRADASFGRVYIASPALHARCSSGAPALLTPRDAGTWRQVPRRTRVTRFAGTLLSTTL